MDTELADGREGIAAPPVWLFEHLSEGVLLVASDGRVLYANPAALRHLALPHVPATLQQMAEDGLSSEQWRTLLEQAPATIEIVSASQALHIEAVPQQWQGGKFVQFVLSPTSRAPAAPPVAAGSEARALVEEQLLSLSRISHELKATLLLEDILRLVLDEALRNTPASSGQISLLSGDGELRKDVTRGAEFSLPEAEAQAMARQRSVTVGDFSIAGETFAALLTPIVFAGEVAGLIQLVAPAEGAKGPFTPATATFLTALANHAAVAIGGAQRFSELQERNTLLQQQTQQIERFVEASRVFQSDRPLDEVYEDLVYAIQEGAGYNVVLLSLAEQEEHGEWLLRRVTAAGLPLEHRRELQQTHQHWAVIEKLLQPEYQLGSAYFVPAEDAAERYPDLALHREADLFPALPARAGDGDAEMWHENDLFFIPMRDSRGQPLGLIRLAAPHDGSRPDLSTARVLEVFSNQAANAIENVQLFHNMRDYAIELHQLHTVSQQTLREPDFDEKLQLIVDGVQLAGWNRASLLLRDEHLGGTRLITSGLSDEERDALKEQILESDSWREHFSAPELTRYRRGSSYFIPHGVDPAYKKAVLGRSTEEGGDVGTDGWHPQDVLIRPLYDHQARLVGLLAMDEPVDGRRPSERKLQTSDLYAQFAISVVEHYRLFGEMERRSQELQTLFEASQALARALDQEGVLRAMGEHMLDAVDADGYAIYTLSRDREESFILDNISEQPELEGLIPAARLERERMELATEVLQSGEIASRLLRRKPEEPRTAVATGAANTHTMIMMPLTLGGEIFGIVELLKVGQQEALAEEKRKLLGAILNQSSTALETAHLIEELDDRVEKRTEALAAESERVKILLRIATELTTSLERARVLNLGLQLVNDVVNAERGIIMLLDEAGEELVTHAATGLDTPISRDGLRSGLRRSDGLAGWVIENRKAVVVADAGAHEAWSREEAKAYRSVLAVPLLASDSVIGVMILSDRQPALFTQEQLSLVEAAATQIASAIQNASLYDLTRQQAQKLGAMARDAQIEVAKIQSILESIADGVVVAEADGTIVMANMPSAHILNLPREQLIGRSVGELMGLYGETGDVWVQTIDAWAEEADELERRVSLKSQMELEDKTVLVHAAPVFANEIYFGTISIFRDITKEVEADRMKSDFVSTVSHELRTPMTSIKGYADLMLLGAAGKLNPPQQRYLDVIKKNAERLKTLVDDLLDISRIETGKTQLKLQPVDIAQLIDDVVRQHVRGRLQEEEQGIEVATEVAPSLPLANADPDQVTRILTNLVDNAMNYTPAGGQVTLRARALGEMIQISVRDTGIGISEEDQKQIFERFYRVEDDRTKDIPGTGLGLSIVRSLVEMHGGELTLSSTPGEGSTFAFTLPLVVQEG
ncbi:MAG: GAF domain-containing protein [Candidatus Promineifilaceae bacterium]|nr:GAF domain-containing protein [Candidatus Promineifilaceae bacterium]